MNLAACSMLPTGVESGVWYGAIQPQHWSTALQTSQTQTFPSRFNGGRSATPPFPTLYLAEDHQVALFEVQALLGSPYPGRGGYLPNPSQPWIVLNVRLNLQSVADITAAASQQALDTTAQELTGDWFGYVQRALGGSVRHPRGLAPTQQLGAAMHTVHGLEGFRTLSAKVPDRRVLVVFPDKVQPGSTIRFVDPGTGKTDSISGPAPQP